MELNIQPSENQQKYGNSIQKQEHSGNNNMQVEEPEEIPQPVGIGLTGAPIQTLQFGSFKISNLGSLDNNVTFTFGQNGFVEPSCESEVEDTDIKKKMIQPFSHLQFRQLTSTQEAPNLIQLFVFRLLTKRKILLRSLCLTLTPIQPPRNQISWNKKSHPKLHLLKFEIPDSSFQQKSNDNNSCASSTRLSFKSSWETHKSIHHILLPL